MFACMHRLWHAVLAEGREWVGFPKSGVTDSCKSLHGYWELNLGPLKK